MARFSLDRIIGIFLIVLLSIFVLLAGSAAFFLVTPQGARMSLRAATKYFFGPDQVAYERIEGSLGRGVRIFNLQVNVPSILPQGSMVRVQEMDVSLARAAFDGLDVTLDNARVLDPAADPVVVNGWLRQGRYHADIFSQSLDLAALRQIIRHFKNPPPLKGELKSLELQLTGTLAKPQVAGVFVVGHIPKGGFLLRDAPVSCALYFMRTGGLWGTYGTLNIHGGFLQAPRTLLHLGESRLTFSGDPANPEIDVHATATVARVHIDIAAKGTRWKPDVRLVSDPPLPEEQLLLMLTTGKKWDLAGVSTGGRKMTPELAGDFIDYFFFGGAGTRLAGFFGFSGISYKLDQTKQGVTLNRDLSDKLDVGYGVAVAHTPDERHQRALTQTVEGEYRVTGKVTLGAQKEIVPAQGAEPSTASRQIPDDRVFLKYRTQF